MLPLAVSLVTLALLLYTIGTWVEKSQRILKVSHLILFWVGFACDLSGTWAMTTLAPANTATNMHTITHTLIGLLALVVMFSHNVYGSRILKLNNETKRRAFPRISLIAWSIWMLSYASGVLLSMR